jgi:hypothetical protein
VVALEIVTLHELITQGAVDLSSVNRAFGCEAWAGHLHRMSMTTVVRVVELVVRVMSGKGGCDGRVDDVRRR